MILKETNRANKEIAIEVIAEFLEAEDHLGTKYSFTKEDFRVQLERLEEFILFELNSGSIDDIRYIDLRYKNAIAVKGNNMEKST